MNKDCNLVRFVYKIRNLFSKKKRYMTNLSIKYSWEKFWHSIDICELWNSLLWFWEFFQTVAKENEMKNVNIHVNQANPWCFDIGLSIDTDTLIWWAKVVWWLVALVAWILEIKKHLKGKKPIETAIEQDWSVTIKNEDWQTLTVQRNTYNTYNNCNFRIDKQLAEAFSPLANNDNIQKISLWEIKEWEERKEIISVDEEEIPYFTSNLPDSQIIENRILQGRIVTMNIDTYWWTIEYMWKKEYIDFSRVKFKEEDMKAINDSMMKKMDIVVRCNIEYERGKIRHITITWVIPNSILEQVDLEK